MWFRRRRRRPQLDLAALERLSEAITRAVALLEERLAAPRAAPERAAPPELVIRRPDPVLPPPAAELEPEPELEPERESESEPEPHSAEGLDGFVLFVATPAGYRLVIPDGITPNRGERLRVEEEWYRVLRLGPSPLPGDRRRCAFLDPQDVTLDVSEPARPRTDHAAGGSASRDAAATA